MPVRADTAAGSPRRATDLPLIVALRGLGATDMLAFIAVAMPTTWIRMCHQWSGLGDFPDAPIAGYLARSASVLYALHGVIVFYLSFDVQRYWPLIRLLACVSIAHGVVILAIDLAAGMPGWWTALEGPASATAGLIVLAAQYWGRPVRIEGSAGSNPINPSETE